MGALFVKISNPTEKAMREFILKNSQNGKFKRGDISDFVDRAIRSYLRQLQA